jgi:hypothetical protein
VPFSLITDAAGRFGAELTPTRNMLVRASKLESPAVASALLAIGVAPAVSLVVSGQAPLTLTGQVTPHKVTLELLAYDAGASHALKHQQLLTTEADGTFRLVPKLKRGSYWIRVVARADAENITGESVRITVNV